MGIHIAFAATDECAAPAAFGRKSRERRSAVRLYRSGVWSLTLLLGGAAHAYPDGAGVGAGLQLREWARYQSERHRINLGSREVARF